MTGRDGDAPLTARDVDILETVRAHDGYFKIDRYRLRHRLHEGGWSGVMNREIFERGHAVAVLLFDPVLDKLVFIEQFRIGALAAFKSPWFDAETVSPWLVECVAGIIDEGETPQDVARRECLEEAGCEISALTPIAHYLVSPGGTTESIFLYCARVDASSVGGVHGLDHEHEDIRVFTMTSAETLDALERGRFTNSMTLIAVQWFKINRQRLVLDWTS
ncbi:MAG: NUDIX domain-containing protein [Alphaproteobacteria bacterium]|nr:NUDIX domain-containing protein [Alphaproteobacteria bacterium]MBF0251453.1 NUDIX domain-containing protein [Alphaproteobacteria bacterium]